MSAVAQRVVVIQDASREVSSSAIKWALDGLQLKPGDCLTLLAILHQVNTPSTFPFKGGKKMMGYKSRVDSNSVLGANQKIIKEELGRKKEEYGNSPEILQIRELYEAHKIDFNISVVAASSPKVGALEAATRMRATWIILDRQMKKDKKYFMEKLSCGISRMKSNNTVEKFRGPKSNEGPKPKESKWIQNSGGRTSLVTYDEMLPGAPEDEDLFSVELFPTRTQSPPKNNSDQEPRTDSDKAPPWNTVTAHSHTKSTSSEHLSLVSSPGIRKTEASSSTSFNYSLKDEEADEKVTRDQEDTEVFENSVCSKCQNGRPKIRWRGEFTYAELAAATDGFSDKNFLSEGGFGSVYKGMLKDGQKVAVKQHKSVSLQGEKEFKSEVYVLRKARHKNVVMLLGSCSEGDHRLLVYEFVCNGSLDEHLSSCNPEPLSWTDRIKIAVEAAEGLNYLHQNNIIHRDMRPSNILVTHDYVPLLGDFGLATTQHDELDHSKTRVVGTVGYLAPEYAESGKVSTKTDVYSFGVVMLQLITGRSTVDKALGEKSLVGWARPLLKERKYPELIDGRIVDSHDVLQLFWMVRVAEKCLINDLEKRWSMKMVESGLKSIMDEETVSGIEDFSPARSDSVSSVPDSTGSQRDDGTLLRRSISSEGSPTSSRSQFSGSFWSEASANAFYTSSSMSINSESSYSGARKSFKKKREKSRSPPVVSYNTMHG